MRALIDVFLGIPHGTSPLSISNVHLASDTITYHPVCTPLRRSATPSHKLWTEDCAWRTGFSPMLKLPTECRLRLNQLCNYRFHFISFHRSPWPSATYGVLPPSREPLEDNGLTETRWPTRCLDVSSKHAISIAPSGMDVNKWCSRYLLVAGCVCARGDA